MFKRFFILLSLSISFLYLPPPALAGDIGTHTAYGHLSPSYCSLTVGLPTTILVPVTAGPAALAEYRDCYQNSSLLILRVTGLSSTTSDLALSTFARDLSSVFTGLGAKTYVVLGNEVNNLSLEYSCSASLSACGTIYARQFAAFNGNMLAYAPTIQVAAAPLDLLNTVYDAAQFFDGAATAYQAADFYAANVYQSSGCAYEALRCSTNSWKWYALSAGQSKPVIFTEFGLDPGDNPSLRAVLDFIASQAPGEPIAITPLIKNTCDSATGAWLLYVRGKLYDAQAQEVDPQNCSAASATTSSVRPTPRPRIRPCTTEDEPEFHPLRPYPGEPCDPLIPRSILPANDPQHIPVGTDTFSTQLQKDYQMRNRVAFSCGNALAPNTPEKFDAAADPPADCTQAGQTVTCIRPENFTLTMDLTDANIPILGNTQIRNLTDAQKMTEYLSWYLNGTVQQSEQNPNPSTSRLVNFSGPLQKLLPFDLKNWDRSELVKGPAGEKFQPPNSGGQYHNYIVGCQKDVNLDYVLTAFKDWFATLKAAVRLSVSFVLRIPTLAVDLYNIVTSAPETARRLSQTLQSIEVTDYLEISRLVSDSGFPQLANDMAEVGLNGADWLHRLGQLIDSLNLDVAVSCTNRDNYKRLKDFLGLNAFGIDNLPPDPTKYSNFSEYWRDYINWRGLVNIPFTPGVNLPGVFDPFNSFSYISGNVWAQLFQNIPFSSLEDTTGEVVVSVSSNIEAGQQDPDVVKDATLKLIIKPKP